MQQLFLGSLPARVNAEAICAVKVRSFNTFNRGAKLYQHNGR